MIELNLRAQALDRSVRINLNYKRSLHAASDNQATVSQYTKGQLSPF
jgi:hypothetical protein